MPSFMTCENKGFKLTFENGLILSTQFGRGNYGSNYNYPDYDREDKSADTVEIAVIDSKGGWMTSAVLQTPEDVVGYVNFSDWLKYFDLVRNWKRKETPDAATPTSAL